MTKLGIILLLVTLGVNAMTVKNKKELKEKLTPLQYKVTVEAGTESPFKNEYWDNKEEGVYVDIIDGTPLFLSKHKYKSGTGWPSFFKPINDEAVKSKLDFKMIIPRKEIVAAKSGAHLGHVFDDGPEPTGKRYCMNSAAMRFIPKNKLAENGLGHLLEEFKDESK